MVIVLSVKLDYGLQGAALSVILTSLLFTFLLVAYILYKRLHADIWDGFSKKAIVSPQAFLKLAIPGMVMVCIQVSLLLKQFNSRYFISVVILLTIRQFHDLHFAFSAHSFCLKSLICTLFPVFGDGDRNDLLRPLE